MPTVNATERGLEAVGIVRQVLTEMGFSPEEKSFEHGAVFRIALEGGPADQGLAQIHVDLELFAFVFLFPGYVAPERRLKVAEFMIRANWGLIVGSFEMNFDTGAFGYGVGIDFSSNGLTAPLVRNVIRSAMQNIEDYADELSAVVEGKMEPAAAVPEAQSRFRQ